MSERKIIFEDVIRRAGGKIYEVGGSVRDRLLNIPRKDKDLLITGLPIELIVNLIKQYGKTILAGKSFGVIKFSPHIEKDVTIDIAIPRKEVSTGVGHRDFTVEYDPDLPIEQDLARRDFTINAMAYDIEKGEIIDPFGGKEDLRNKIIRVVFPQAFAEDPLRLLRGVQFAARFEFSIEEKTLELMKESASLIKTVSKERIAEELRKLFTAKRPSLGFEIMKETGTLKYVLPELNAVIGIVQEKQENDDVFRHTMKVVDAAASDPAIQHKGDINLMWAALLHDIGKANTMRFDAGENRIVFFGHQIVSARMAAKILTRLKCTTTGVDIALVSKLIENHMFETKSFFSDKAIRRFISKVGKGDVLKLIDLRIADNRGGKNPDKIGGVLKLKKRIIEEINKKPPFGVNDLAIDGHDIMAMGVPEGPNVGKILKQLVEMVLDDPLLNTREQLIAIAEKLVDNIRGSS